MTSDGDGVAFEAASPVSDPPALRIRGPADLVHVIPYLLGFHPTQSLVLVGVERGRVGVTARLDLADVALPDLLENAVAGMCRGGVRTFVGLVYDSAAKDHRRRSDSARLPGSELAADLAAVVASCGARLDDVVLVGRDRLWSYVCADTSCCPAEGRPLSPDPGIAAAATFAGLVALPDRESLAELLDPLPEPERNRLVPLLERAERAAIATAAAGALTRANRAGKRALFAAARAGDVPGATFGQRDEEVAAFAVALRRYEVRDSLWLAVDERRIDGRALWRYLGRRLPAPFDAAPLFLFAWASYRAGDGALAGIAAHRALDSDPHYSAADLLLAALSHAVDPRRMPRLRPRRPA